MRFNIKLLFSPIKLLGCLIFIILIPIFMYVPTYFDFLNVSVIYMPFVGIVLFSEISILDRENHISEITFLSDKKPIRTFLQRYLISTFLLLCFIVIANTVFKVTQPYRDIKIVESISFFEYFIIVGCSCIFIGTISMTISLLLNNLYVGYGLTIVYWIFWNINCQNKTLMNPFPFIANPTFYEKPLILIYVYTVLLIILNVLIIKQSPFYTSDKIRKIFTKFKS